MLAVVNRFLQIYGESFNVSCKLVKGAKVLQSGLTENMEN